MDQFMHQILRNQLVIMQHLQIGVVLTDIISDKYKYEVNKKMLDERWKTVSLLGTLKPGGGYWVEKPGGPSVVQSVD